MSQEDFMLKDECLIVNYNDEVIGADNKYNVHKFTLEFWEGYVEDTMNLVFKPEPQEKSDENPFSRFHDFSSISIKYHCSLSSLIIVSLSISTISIT